MIHELLIKVQPVFGKVNSDGLRRRCSVSASVTLMSSLACAIVPSERCSSDRINSMERSQPFMSYIQSLYRNNFCLIEPSMKESERVLT